LNCPEVAISPDWLADPATLLPFILIGFAAQLVDGALGMAFGQISSTLLIAFGVPPAAASAGVHTAETFTTAVSGVSHVAHRNVDWWLFLRIVIPGIVNTFIALFKDTSLVIIIGLFDLLNSVKQAAADPKWLGMATEGYVFAALVFWIFCFGMSRYSMHLERKLDTGHKR